ncbi:MAG: ABC transporter permease [Oscillospiraceae bacterium]|nr:ABC transporter permease [Oscillospiraceae bacterium]
MLRRHSRALRTVYLTLVFSFMYVPIAVMAVFSFNESKSRTVFTGFTLDWYKNLFRNEMILQSLAISLVVALVSAGIATVIGTMAAIGINNMKRGARSVVLNISYMPVINPEIVTGVSLMLLFVVYKNFANGLFERLGITDAAGETVVLRVFGMATLLIAHITFCLPYVIFNVSPKLRQMDVRMYEAALDLGCNPRQAFFKVVLPEIMPAVLSAFLICLTYSIDDFIISYFSSGTMQTLPITIFSMTRKKVSPEINALSTIMFVVILAIILLMNMADSRREKRLSRRDAR